MGILNLIFSLSSCSLILLMSVVESKTYWEDIKVLKQFKNGIESSSVSPAGSCLSSWDFSVDPCDHLFTDKFTCGFRCDALVSGFNRVTELTLDQAGYSAPLSSGELPPSVASLVNLEELYFDNNIIQGGIITTTFDSLISFKRLEIQSNKLQGEFPELGSLQNLFFLDASNNAFSGPLPSSLPSSLLQISMRNNSFTGTIPQHFKNLVHLEVLDLSHNQLGGGDSVPSFLFTHPSLQQLTLSFNSFTSVQSPPTPAMATMQNDQLIAVDLSNNGIEGFIPWFLGLMPKLSALSLENNKLTGMIPTQFAIKAAGEGGSIISPFERLLLGGNYLFGPIPVPLMELKAGSVDVRLNDNCFYWCPVAFFFCLGGNQKSLLDCKSFNPFIP